MYFNAYEHFDIKPFNKGVFKIENIKKGMVFTPYCKYDNNLNSCVILYIDKNIVIFRKFLNEYGDFCLHNSKTMTIRLKDFLYTNGLMFSHDAYYSDKKTFEKYKEENRKILCSKFYIKNDKNLEVIKEFINYCMNTTFKFKVFEKNEFYFKHELKADKNFVNFIHLSKNIRF